MGTIDKKWFKLTCTSCGISESQSVLDKGSGWSGSHWHVPGGFASFNTKAEGGGAKNPEIVSATCKSCSGKAEVESTYFMGSGPPEGY